MPALRKQLMVSGTVIVYTKLQQVKAQRVLLNLVY